MNIAIFASAFHPHVGGVEELVRQLAHEYRRQGHQPFIITNQWPQNLPAREEFEGLTIYRFPMRIPEGALKVRLKHHLTQSATRRQMLNVLRERKADVVHIQCISSNGYHAMLCARELGLPLVATNQGEITMDAGRLYQTSAFMNDVMRQLMHEADAITGVSQKTLDDMGEHVGGYPRDVQRVIFNGANLSDFEGIAPFEYSKFDANGARKPYVLAIGRMVPQKGFDVLLPAFARALEINDMNGHDLVLAGDGDILPALKKQAAELGVGERIFFPGRADRPQAAAFFKGSSFFVLPSRSDEGLPVVSAEAMAAGKAIVGTTVGGVPEAVVEDKTGLLVPRENADALGEKMAQMAGDDAMRTRMGEAAKERAPLFSWPYIAAQYLDLYREVIDKHAAE